MGYTRAMPHPPWNDSYASGFLPWDTGQAEPELVEAVRSGRVQPQRALEVGCGTGTNAIWLAEHGFEVVAVDVAPLAIERARLKDTARRCRFEVLDFLAQAPVGGPYGLVFDRGVFHVFDEASERRRFATHVASVLRPGGQWLSLIGSTEGPAREGGPPRRSAREVLEAIEPELEILELASTRFTGHEAMAWRCWSRRRATPAQPSTVR